MERIEKVRTYVLLVAAAAGSGSAKARELAKRVGQELGYGDPTAVMPAAAIHPALLEIEQALNGAPVAEGTGDTWG